ncbi:hypothetical protein [Pseudoclavibacter sp. JSM 162008]|uniref:hypothetical protein n=1 Tax=Pseudoclavibacter sp. JSM 162008 TaxID=3229855 RepID=UPI0035259ECC
MIGELDAFVTALRTGNLADKVDVGRTRKEPPYALVLPGSTDDEQTRQTGPHAAEQLVYAVKCVGESLDAALLIAAEVDKRLRPPPMKFGVALDVEGRDCSLIERGATDTYPIDDEQPSDWVAVVLYKFTSEPT